MNPNLKILVVDDMMTMRKIVKKTVMGLGFTNIEEAEDGLIAWNKFIEAEKNGIPYQLVISDWNMPNMTGLDFLKRVRATNKTTPFLLVTAEGEASQVMEAVKAGVSGYLMKPFSIDSLREKLTKIKVL